MAAGDEAFIAPGGGAQAQPAARALGAPSPSGLPGKRALRQRSPSPTVLPHSPFWRAATSVPTVCTAEGTPHPGARLGVHGGDASLRPRLQSRESSLPVHAPR